MNRPPNWKQRCGRTLVTRPKSDAVAALTTAPVQPAMLQLALKRLVRFPASAINSIHQLGEQVAF